MLVLVLVLLAVGRGHLRGEGATKLKFNLRATLGRLVCLGEGRRTQARAAGRLACFSSASR